MSQNSRTRIARAIALALCGAALSGCAATHVAHMSENVTAKVKRERQTFSQSTLLITASPNAYLAGAVVRTPRKRPAVLMQQFVHFSHVPMSIGRFASLVEDQDGIEVDVSDLHRSVGVAGGIMQVAAAPHRVDAFYKGPLYGVLDNIASQTRAWWRFKNGEVQFYRTVTRTFELAALPEKCRTSSSISTVATASSGGSSMMGGGGLSGQGGGSSGGGSGSGNSAGVQAGCKYDSDAWSAIRTNLRSLGAGSTVVVDSSTGLVTVTGSPNDVHRIGRIIHSWNSVSGQQVEITVHVYEVQLSREDNYGVSPSVKFQSLLQNEGWSVNGVPLPTAQTATGTLGADILSNTGLTKRQTGYNGSTLAVQALSTLGHVVNVYNNAQITLNGVPTTFANTSTTGYTYEVGSSLAANVGASSFIEPGSFTGGLATVLTPRVVGGNIFVNVSLQDNSLTALVPRTSGGETIQTPNYQTLATLQDVRLKPGQQLLLTGFSGRGGNSTLNGPIGGGVDAQTSRTLVAVLVTARVL